MRIHTMRPRALAAAVVASLVAVACTGSTTHDGALDRPTSGEPPSSATTANGVPNPFTVVHTYSDAQLGLDRPANLAIGPNGNLYVTDASQRVAEISPTGDVLTRWGGVGSAQGKFTFVPHEPGVRGVSAAIAVGADGAVYVADNGNYRVEVFSPTGTFIRQFGGLGLGNGKFEAPDYVAVDREGDVYVADDSMENISKFSPNGTFEWAFGGSTNADPELTGHYHIATVDSHDRVVATNDDVNRILYLDSAEQVVDAFTNPVPVGSCDITVDPAGDIFVNSCQEPLQSPHFTNVFDRNHTLVGAWSPSPFGWAPRFGPNGEVFTLGEDGSILRLKVNLPGA